MKYFFKNWGRKKGRFGILEGFILLLSLVLLFLLAGYVFLKLQVSSLNQKIEEKHKKFQHYTVLLQRKKREIVKKIGKEKEALKWLKNCLSEKEFLQFKHILQNISQNKIFEKENSGSISPSFQALGIKFYELPVSFSDENRLFSFLDSVISRFPLLIKRLTLDSSERNVTARIAFCLISPEWEGLIKKIKIPMAEEKLKILREIQRLKVSGFKQPEYEKSKGKKGFIISSSFPVIKDKLFKALICSARKEKEKEFVVMPQIKVEGVIIGSRKKSVVIINGKSYRKRDKIEINGESCRIEKITPSFVQIKCSKEIFNLKVKGP